ncbi:MAG: hypothetical protein GF390_03930, partial [Candidatus Pacebacteria bacterium]|nr:hypothetical protein [Candidatus Paceibacterota bacterium]
MSKLRFEEKDTSTPIPKKQDHAFEYLLLTNLERRLNECFTWEIFWGEISQKRINLAELVCPVEKQGTVSYHINSRGRELASNLTEALLFLYDFDHRKAIQDLQAAWRNARNYARTDGTEINQTTAYLVLQRICQSAIGQLHYKAAFFNNQNKVGVTNEQQANRDKTPVENGQLANQRLFYGLTPEQWQIAANRERQLREKAQQLLKKADSRVTNEIENLMQ